MNENHNMGIIETNQETISILCPTRGRPNQLLEMIESATSKASKPENLEFCIYIDNDDPSYAHVNFGKHASQVKILRGPRMWLSAMYNSLLTVATGEYFFWSGDDVEFLTECWDELIIQAFNKFPSKLAVIHVNDLATSYPQEFATIGAVHLNWVKLFGYIFTHHMRDNGIDFWISEVANRVNRRVYLSEVRIEHKQYRQGKVAIDKTYLDRLDDHQTYDPMKIYFKLRDERRRDALMLANSDSEIVLSMQKRYFLAWVYWRYTTRNFDSKKKLQRKIYLGAISNFEFISYLMIKMRIIKRKNHWVS